MTIENDIRLSRLDKTKEAATHANEELDWPNLNKYREENEKLANTENKGDRIVLIGDSITEGWSNFDPDFFTRNNFSIEHTTFKDRNVRTRISSSNVSIFI